MNFLQIILLILSIYNIKAIPYSKYLSKSNSTKCSFFYLLSEKIVTELNDSHHLVIVALEKPDKTPGYTDIILPISNSKPSVFVDSINTRFFEKTELLLRDVSGYVVFLNGPNNTNPIFDFLKNLTYKLGYNIRPKCLFIYFHNNENPEILKPSQKFAWSKNYLDLSIIDVNMKECNLSRIHDYNPFTNFFSQRDITSPLFPNKAVNVKGYPFKIVLRHKVMFPVDVYGNLYSPIDKNFILLWIAVKHINFKFALVDMYKNETRDHYRWLKTGRMTADLVPRPLEIEETPPRELPKWIVNFECERFVAFVPFKYVRKIELPYQAVTYLTIMLVMTTGIVVARKLGWLTARFWNMLNVLSLLMGCSSTVEPLTWMQKYTAIWCMFLAMTHSSNFYSDLVELELTPRTVNYDTFKDLEESNLVVYVFKPWFRLVFEHEHDPYIKQIQWKSIKETEFAETCFHEMRIHKNQICIAPEYYRYAQSPLIRKSKAVLTCKNWVYRLEAGSPYLEPLKKITDRLFETGFVVLINKNHENLEDLRYRNPKRHIKTEYAEDEEWIKRETKTNVFVRTVMGLALAMGLGVSTVVFLFELAAVYLKYLERRRERYMRRMY